MFLLVGFPCCVFKRARSPGLATNWFLLLEIVIVFWTFVKQTSGKGELGMFSLFDCLVALDLTRSDLAAALASLSFYFSTFRKCCSSNNDISSGLVASLE
jgi:hypothetical protein